MPTRSRSPTSRRSKAAHWLAHRQCDGRVALLDSAARLISARRRFCSSTEDSLAPDHVCKALEPELERLVGDGERDPGPAGAAGAEAFAGREREAMLGQ